jgi:DNA-binding transcriptional LysR family regulator
MDLQRLERFLVLAAEKNYSRAAEKLNIPQPHLSRQIQQLEKELGVELFNRQQRPLKLTASGLVFLADVEQILAHIQRAKATAQRAQRGETGRLTVGINNSISNSLLPEILSMFRSQFPDVQLSLQELLMKDSIQKLQNRELDVDFVNVYNVQNLDGGENWLTHEVIHQEPLVVVLPDTHALVDRPQIWLQDLKDDLFVLPDPIAVPALSQLIYTACEQAKFHPKAVQTATWMPTILGLVAGGMGVALLPANAASLRRSRVVYRSLHDTLPAFEIAVAWRTDNDSQALHNFLNVVRTV